MATLAADSVRTYSDKMAESRNDLEMVGSDTIYEGAAVGDNGSGYARPLVAADPFYGFAFRQAVNAGSDGDERVRVRERGEVELSVAGVADVDDIGETVYASDDDTFTLTSGSNTAIGKVSRHVSGTIVKVAFEAGYVASL